MINLFMSTCKANLSSLRPRPYSYPARLRRGSISLFPEPGRIREDRENERLPAAGERHCGQDTPHYAREGAQGNGGGRGVSGLEVNYSVSAGD